jgi:hypothetical protein
MRTRFMEDLIITIFQALFEFLLEVFFYIPFDWPSTSRSQPESETIIGSCFGWFIGGCILSWLLMLVLNHTFITHPAFRIVNLVLAPITSAFVSQAIARHRSKRNHFIIPRNHFWQAFWFTLGIVAVRFAYAVRH